MKATQFILTIASTVLPTMSASAYNLARTECSDIAVDALYIAEARDGTGGMPKMTQTAVLDHINGVAKFSREELREVERHIALWTYRTPRRSPTELAESLYTACVQSCDGNVCNMLADPNDKLYGVRPDKASR